MTTPDPADRPYDTTGDTNGDDSLTVEDGEVIETDREDVVVRRAPKVYRFMLAGAILGVIVALVLTFSFPPNPTFSAGQVFGFLLLACGVVGVALGAVLALVLDRRSARRARTVGADHSSAHPLE